MVAASKDGEDNYAGCTEGTAERRQHHDGKDERRAVPRVRGRRALRVDVSCREENEAGQEEPGGEVREAGVDGGIDSGSMICADGVA